MKNFIYKWIKFKKNISNLSWEIYNFVSNREIKIDWNYIIFLTEKELEEIKELENEINKYELDEVDKDIEYNKIIKKFKDLKEFIKLNYLKFNHMKRRTIKFDKEKYLNYLRKKRYWQYKYLINENEEVKINKWTIYKKVKEIIKRNIQNNTLDFENFKKDIDELEEELKKEIEDFKKNFVLKIK